MNEQDTVTALAALAQPVRLKAFRLLVVAGQEGLTPGRMAETLELPAPTLSFHLKELTHAQLVTQEREGRHLIYRANYGRMNEVLAYLTSNCCQGEACLSPTALECPC
ncbi:MAG: winged helix-turn-helix transcriptional regulator [Betaproteobacteria bacterium]|nr:winged helix-turn-helix transcriptional regulator [Betaproteobacteria bacterium]MDE2131367.1 winged helix-turn-helix transcriptional regulator [Betaproteobacteria bacterium]MDE2212757.1 winged helix-turn-helix transcriptional regulator [Betaproteobacteria bacterium]MDE2354762.1 winged helix-turn-helix transcriptional regulator [Betaproteobacteria bacterium]